MALQISPGNQARIAELLEHGDYHDDDVVAVERALDLLNEVERLNYLKSLLAVSAEQAAKGEVIPYDSELREEIKGSARGRFAAGEVAGPDVRP